MVWQDCWIKAIEISNTEHLNWMVVSYLSAGIVYVKDLCNVGAMFADSGTQTTCNVNFRRSVFKKRVHSIFLGNYVTIDET